MHRSTDFGSTLRTRCYAFVCICIALGSATLIAAEPPVDDKWESAIAAFEQQDAKEPPPPGAVLFVGSSSIRRWDLPKSFPKLTTINRGFGGSQVADSLQYAPRIILPYHPATVVIYAGDNDIGAGKSAEHIANEVKQLFDVIHTALPDTQVIYLSTKLSIKRWELRDTIRDLNNRVAKMAVDEPKLTFVDVATLLLNGQGEPDPAMFVEDGLHLSEAGYAAWAKKLSRVISQTAASASK